MLNTAERVSSDNPAESWVLKRSELAYKKAKEIISGKVLEIGCGNAYAVEELVSVCDEYVLLDKMETDTIKDLLKLEKVKFIKAVVPPMNFIPDNSYDFVLSFQVIEHIKKDIDFIKEIYRILKPGGQFLVTTPNRSMSLSRNPWHIREYLPQELKKALNVSFTNVECNGVFGKERAMEYYRKNKESVEKFRKWDILGLERRLPASLFRIPYDILNGINRNLLLKKAGTGGSEPQYSTDDFYVDTVSDQSLDLYFIAKK
jgi:ubiquinone/menaquinone biosynthesis C-methylase UbiE